MSKLFDEGFYKYQATGNDFILLDFDISEGKTLKDTTLQIAGLCHRRFGIGADGLICILPPVKEGTDFEMVYYNSDGKRGSMCGNGGRASLHFYLTHLAPHKKEVAFINNGKLYYGGSHEKGIFLKMTTPSPAEQLAKGVFFTDTGSPHVVIEAAGDKEFGNDEYFDALSEEYRYHPKFMPGGTNVNFYLKIDGKILMRTFERGVEDETYSCGTGTVAVATVLRNSEGLDFYTIDTRGGRLFVSFEGEGEVPTLIGPAVEVFKGKFTLIESN